MSLKSKIESLFFISTKPLTAKKISEIAKVGEEEAEKTILELKQEYDTAEKGIKLMKIGRSYQMTTSPDSGKIIKDFIKDEQTGELTKAALESLTIIAYRGPITKADLDMIRGVNCALILRNLMIKGLVEAHDDKVKMTTAYDIAFDFMKFLGLTERKELPDFESLTKDENLEKILHPEGQRELNNPEKEPKNIEE
jgi:segregation and condensation protein B